MILLPSMGRSVGSSTPAIASAVANMSIVLTSAEVTLPGVTCVGHRTSAVYRRCQREFGMRCAWGWGGCITWHSHVPLPHTAKPTVCTTRQSNRFGTALASCRTRAWDSSIHTPSTLGGTRLVRESGRTDGAAAVDVILKPSSSEWPHRT
jgi:hypothetical protein